MKKNQIIIILQDTLKKSSYGREVNVIVSDGFTGNVALKTAEGTANFITSELKNAMTGTL